jgi:hypothetical protein
MHALAEAQYEPAKELFREFLADDDRKWREEGIRLLGFHFSLDPNGETVNIFRQLLDSDPQPGVRIAAAHAIGGRTSWPEYSLFKALKYDHDEIVVRSAFGALLEQAGLPFYKIMEEEKKVENGEIKPTLRAIRSIIEKEGIELQFPE